MASTLACPGEPAARGEGVTSFTGSEYASAGLVILAGQGHAARRMANAPHRHNTPALLFYTAARIGMHLASHLGYKNECFEMVQSVTPVQVQVRSLPPGQASQPWPARFGRPVQGRVKGMRMSPCRVTGGSSGASVWPAARAATVQGLLDAGACRNRAVLASSFPVRASPAAREPRPAGRPRRLAIQPGRGAPFPLPPSRRVP